MYTTIVAPRRHQRNPARRFHAFWAGALSLSVLAGVGLPADAAVTTHGRQMHVTQIYSFPTYGGGDVVFATDDPMPGCEAGFWLRPSDPGFKTTLALVTAAYLTKGLVRVWAFDDSLWSGSAGRYCRLDTFNPV